MAAPHCKPLGSRISGTAKSFRLLVVSGCMPEESRGQSSLYLGASHLSCDICIPVSPCLMLQWRVRFGHQSFTCRPVTALALLPLHPDHAPHVWPNCVVNPEFTLPDRQVAERSQTFVRYGIRRVWFCVSLLSCSLLIPSLTILYLLVMV